VGLFDKFGKKKEKYEAVTASPIDRDWQRNHFKDEKPFTQKSEAKKPVAKSAPKTEEKKTAAKVAPKAEEKKLVAKAAPKTEEKKTAAKAAPKAEEKKPAAKAAPKTEEKKPAAKAAPKAEEKKTAAKAAPKAEEKKTAAKAAPKTEEKKPAAKAAPKAEEKKPVAKSAPKAEEKKPVAKAAPKAEEKKPAAKVTPKTQVKKNAAKTVEPGEVAESESIALDTTEAVTESRATRNGKFDIRKAKDGRFFFNLYASNQVVIASSQMYSSSSAAINGIKSVMVNASKSELEDNTLQKKPEPKPFPKWEMYIDKAGEFRFRLYAPNGNCICHSHGYQSKSGCKGGIDSITRFATEDSGINKTYLK